MATRFCGICGTEVDETAAFCPSCGNPIEPDAQLSDIPPAPAWPEPEPEPEAVAEREPEREPEQEPDAVRVTHIEPMRQVEPATDEPQQPEQTASWRPVAESRSSAEPVAAAGPQADNRRPASEQVELPFTWPLMLSGWLIGVGSLVAALSVLLAFRTFANPVTLIFFLLLLAVSASVFLSSNIPDFANRRLWVLVVVVAAFGIGLWRVGFGANFAGVVFFLGALAAAAGAMILELGRDRPMGGPVG
jgi:hypothetical protein